MEIWMEDRPGDVLQLAKFFLETGRTSSVTAVEDPQRRAAGFETKEGIRILCRLDYATGNPESPFFDAFAPILFNARSREDLAKYLSAESKWDYISSKTLKEAKSLAPWENTDG